MPTDTDTIDGASIQRKHSAEEWSHARAKQQVAIPAESSQKCRCCPDDSPGLERGEGGHVA
jgi:hypothetical protein